MARIPGVDSLFSLVQLQAEALAALPGTLSSLNTAIRSLVDTAAQAREAVQALQRLTIRVDSLVEELEEPVRALKPGLARVAVVLDDPIVDELPDTLRQLRSDVLPMVRALAETQERVAFVAGSTERMMSFLDETSRTLAGLPGAALLGRRWTPGRPGAAGPASEPTDTP